MANDHDWISAGFDRIEAQVLDANGNMSGTTTTLANGSFSNGFRIWGGKVAPITIPNPATVPVSGDDAFLGSFIFPSDAVRTFRLQNARANLDPNQYMGSGNAYDIGGGTVGFLDVFPFNPINVALIANSRAQSQKPGNVGLGIFSGIIVAKAQMVPTGRETFQERAAGQFAYEVVFSQSDRFPWGETFVPSVHGISLASLVPWSSSYRKAFATFRGDGSTVNPTFGPLAYTPATTSLNDVVIYKDQYRQTTNFAVNATSKMITYTGTLAAASVISIYYDNLGQ